MRVLSIVWLHNGPVRSTKARHEHGQGQGFYSLSLPLGSLLGWSNAHSLGFVVNPTPGFTPSCWFPWFQSHAVDLSILKPAYISYSLLVVRRKPYNNRHIINVKVSDNANIVQQTDSVNIPPALQSTSVWSAPETSLSVLARSGVIAWLVCVCFSYIGEGGGTDLKQRLAAQVLL